MCDLAAGVETASASHSCFQPRQFVQRAIMQPFNQQEGGANPSVWMQGGSSWASTTGHLNDQIEAVALAKMDALDAEGTLNAIINDSVHSVDVPLQNPNFQDHEMFSWLHFPIDDAIEKGFYADFLRELPGSGVQIVKHSFNQLGLQQEVAVATPPHNSSEALLNDLIPPSPVVSSFPMCPVSQSVVETVESRSTCPTGLRNMVAGADAAIVVERGPVITGIGTSHHGEAETYGGMQAPLSVDSSWQGAMPITRLKSLDMVALADPNPSLLDPSQRQFSSLSQEALPLPVLRPLDVSFSSAQPTPHRNFAHFSSPVAETRASLHALSASSGPSSIERARQQNGQGGKADGNGIKQPLQREPAVVMEIDNRQTSLPLQVLVSTSSSGQAGESCRGKSIAEDNIVSSHLSNSAITASNKAMEKLHITEQTCTSQSRGSSSSSDEKSGKEAATTMKRRLSGVDDSECQSEDLEEITNGSKKQMKRSRAAEMHNLCERKRRDRINEKLMALRDLMPNSSKTAKASILDEAIEYVKLLQSQLQAWSARTGICIPPALIPGIGMQHVQVPALPHMGLGMGVGMGVGLGMGMGMGMGMGIGLMDVNAAAVAAGRSMLPMPPYSSHPSSLPSHAMASIQQRLPAMNMVEGQENPQNAQILNPYNIYVPQQAQPAPMNVTMYRNMELYNAYMQGHQQQQHQLQQLQQQQQQQLIQQQQLQGNKVNKATR